jgi:hypothetical protein
MEDDVARPRFSLASIGLAVLILAIDFALFKSAMLSDDGEPWRLLVFLLVPVIDALLIVLYRLRRPKRRTAGAVGFVAAGALATAALIAVGVLGGGSWIYVYSAIERPIALPILNGLTRLLGNAAMRTIPMELTMIIFLEFLLPMTLVSIPPLFAGLVGGWIARRLVIRDGSWARISALPQAQPTP